ncbi:MAG: low molecular weight phosphatase family protein [Chitinophagales bacterium]
MTNPRLQSYIKSLIADYQSISSDRKQLLENLSAWIRLQLKENKKVQLNFICTHNSRRSHFGQIWAEIAAFYYKIQNIHTYSGGTETTAFNFRSVAALQRAGFEARIPEQYQNEANPHYHLYFEENSSPIICFSKVYDNSFNPSKDFAAIMTCNHADVNCPVVFGALKRFPITYEDPKSADDSSQEKAKYDERCRQIATEMFYMISKL